VISDKRFRILAIVIFLLTPPGAFAGPGITLPEFVITPEKLQRFLWRDFLIEFPNTYTTANHRILKTGTVVFYGSDHGPTHPSFANQKIITRADGLVSRTTRLKTRSSSGNALVDIVVHDVGEDLKETPLAQLLMGKLPLDLEESTLQEKKIAFSDDEGTYLNINTRIRPGQAGEVAIILSLLRKGRSLFRIEEIRKGDSRGVTWFLDDEETFGGRHTLRATKVKTDWMLFGSEYYNNKGREITSAAFQSSFSDLGVQRLLIGIQEQMKRMAKATPKESDDEAPQE